MPFYRVLYNNEDYYFRGGKEAFKGACALVMKTLDDISTDDERIEIKNFEEVHKEFKDLYEKEEYLQLLTSWNAAVRGSLWYNQIEITCHTFLDEPDEVKKEKVGNTEPKCSGGCCGGGGCDSSGSCGSEGQENVPVSNPTSDEKQEEKQVKKRVFSSAKKPAKKSAKKVSKKPVKKPAKKLSKKAAAK